MAQVARPGAVDEINIAPWEQFVFNVRTAVCSAHHNFSAAVADTLSATWRPTSADEPVWVLGRCYAPLPSEEQTVAEGDSGKSSTATGFAAAGVGSLDEFVAAWAEIMRMTYRKGFAPMYRPVRQPNAGSVEHQYISLTSDAGWGCMIRVGQMLLAAVLRRHQGMLGGTQSFERLFLDDVCPERSPFSIYGFIRATGAAAPCAPEGGRHLTQKLPGDWFGPTTISETIAALVERSPALSPSLAVYVDPDGVLYSDEVRALALCDDDADPPAGVPMVEAEAELPGKHGGDDEDGDFTLLTLSPAYEVCSTSSGNSPLLLAQDGLAPEPLALSPPALHGSRRSPAPLEESPEGGMSKRKWKRDVLLLFPVQLGVEKHINEAAAASVLQYFCDPCSLGAMGGRPRMAHFFVGRHAETLLYLDPHVVQPAAVLAGGPGVPVDSSASVGLESFRNTPAVQTIAIDSIDSSISFAFLCRCEADLQQVVKGIRRVESIDANAPLHAEQTRPAALRAPQGLLGHGSWDDIDLECLEGIEGLEAVEGPSSSLEVGEGPGDSFMEVQSLPPSRPAASPFTEVRETKVCDVDLPDLQHPDNGVVEAEDEGPRRPKVVVALPWSMINS